MNLILLGPPGAGKGTQAKMICQKFNLCHLSTGDILRNEVSNGTDLGVLAKDVIDKGQLVSDDIIIKIIKSFLNENNNKFSGFLFDGFPRSLDQANKLNDLKFLVRGAIYLWSSPKLGLFRADAPIFSSV